MASLPEIPPESLASKAGQGIRGRDFGNRRLAFKLCVSRVELVGARQNQARSFSGTAPKRQRGKKHRGSLCAHVRPKFLRTAHGVCLLLWVENRMHHLMQ